MFTFALPFSLISAIDASDNRLAAGMPSEWASIAENQTNAKVSNLSPWPH